ncbi:MAG: hypothetical protein M5U12_08915 [Verrucomicrobia bacterium]|nr:hypothetical protein [Verrucomicrobiota bacterium]
MAVDSGCPGLESFPGGEEPTVVAQVVDANFEAVVSEPGAKGAGHGVGAFGDEVETGTETEFQFQLGQGLDLGEAFGTFDVVGEYQGELFAVGPTRPAVRLAPGGFEDGPDVAAAAQDPLRVPPPQGHAQLPGEEGLGGVVEAGAEHGAEGQGGKGEAVRAER